jgi:hypothetical protein
MKGRLSDTALRTMLATALALGGCESPPPSVMAGGSRLKASEPLALVVQPFDPGSGAFDEPLGRGESAAVGAATGSRAGLACLEELGRGTSDGPGAAIITAVGVLFCLALVPVGAAVGAVAGASAADSVDDIEKATLALRTALESADPAEGIGRTTTNALHARGVTVEPAEEPGGAEHTLTMSVSSFDLLVIGRIDAEAAVVLNVQADLKDRNGTTRSPPMSYGFIGEPVDYLDLARDDAELLTRMIEKAYVRTAELIVDDLYPVSRNHHQNAEPRWGQLPSCRRRHCRVCTSFFVRRRRGCSVG